MPHRKLPVVDPGWPRALLGIGAMQSLAMGIALLVAPNAFESPAFATLFDIFPKNVWAATFIIVGLIEVLAVRSKEVLMKAQVALVFKGTMFLMMAASFANEEFVNGAASPWSWIIYLTFAAFVGVGLLYGGSDRRAP